MLTDASKSYSMLKDSCDLLQCHAAMLEDARHIANCMWDDYVSSKKDRNWLWDFPPYFCALFFGWYPTWRLWEPRKKIGETKPHDTTSHHGAATNSWTLKTRLPESAFEKRNQSFHNKRKTWILILICSNGHLNPNPTKGFLGPRFGWNVNGYEREIRK